MCVSLVVCLSAICLDEKSESECKTSVAYLCGTVFLGILFIWIQAKEYLFCSFNISSSVLGSSFFILTGFHGAHVVIGIVFLMKALMGLLHTEKTILLKQLESLSKKLSYEPDKTEKEETHVPHSNNMSPHHHMGLEIAIWY